MKLYRLPEDQDSALSLLEDTEAQEITIMVHKEGLLVEVTVSIDEFDEVIRMYREEEAVS